MEITGEAKSQKIIGNEGLLTKDTPTIISPFIAPESKASMKDFLDPSTLSDRLRERNTLCQPYLTADGLWHLGRFIVKRRHEDGSVATLLYTIQNIDEAKRTEIAYQEKLKKSAREAQIANQAKTDFLRRLAVFDLQVVHAAARGVPQGFLLVIAQPHYAVFRVCAHDIG